MVYSKRMAAAGNGLSRHYRRRSLVTAPAPSMSTKGAAPQMVKRAFVRKESEVKKVKVKRACLECRTLTTPCWRYGPNGLRTLCNACGLRYRKQRSSSQLNTKQRSKSSSSSSSLYNSKEGMSYEEMKQRQKEKQMKMLALLGFNKSKNNNINNYKKKKKKSPIVNGTKVRIDGGGGKKEAEEAALLLLSLSSSAHFIH